MVQNHMLQLLCLVAMEPPYSLDPDVVRNAKMEVLRCLRPITDQDVGQVTSVRNTAPAQPMTSPSPGIVARNGIHPTPRQKPMSRSNVSSKTGAGPESPSICARGKRSLNEPARSRCNSRIFRTSYSTPMRSNRNRLMYWHCVSSRKKALAPHRLARTGTRAETHPRLEMDFQYSDVFGRPSPEAYERLLLDVMAGRCVTIHAGATRLSLLGLDTKILKDGTGRVALAS